MNDCKNDGPQDERNLARVHNLGLDVISKYNKYTNYTSTQTWAVGVGSLIGGYDIRDYDPAKYSAIELIVLALQDKFKDIGGTGVRAVEYIKLLRKHYPKTSSSILRLSVVSTMDNNPLRPVIITDTYHPELSELYVQAANDAIGDSSIRTNEELEKLRDRIDDEIVDLIFDMVLT